MPHSHRSILHLAACIYRSAKEFEDYGKLVAGKYLVAHSRSPHYKALLKTLFKAALAPLPVQVTCEHSYTIACLLGCIGPASEVAGI